MEEALRAGVVRAVLTSSSSAVGAARPGETIDEDHPFTVGRLGDRLHQLQARGRAGLDALGGQGAARRDRQPVVRPRPRRPEPERNLQRAGPPSPASPHPGLPRRSDQHRRRARRRQGPRARRRARRGGRAVSAHRAELHAAASLRRPQPDRRGAAASGPDAGTAGGGGRRGDGAGRLAPADLRGRGPLRDASGSPTATTRRGRSSAGSPGRTRRPSRTRSAGSSRSSASGPRATGSPTWRCAARAASCDTSPSSDDRAAPRPLSLRHTGPIPLPLWRGRAAAQQAGTRVPNRARPPTDARTAPRSSSSPA